MSEVSNAAQVTGFALSGGSCGSTAPVRLLPAVRRAGRDAGADRARTLRWAGIDPATPQGAQKRPRFEAYLKPVADRFMIKRDPYFRDQFRRQVETGVRHRLEHDMWDVLAQSACPTPVIRGARSDMFAQDTAPKVLAANPRIRLVEIDGGHNVAGDNPDGFDRAARQFLDEGSAGSA